MSENLIMLEGDFNEVFEIETERDQEMEATAFLAPDLMSFLMDNFDDCDFEFFDNKVRILFPNIKQKTSYQPGLFIEMQAHMSRAMKFFEKFNQKFLLLKVDRTLPYEIKVELTKEEKRRALVRAKVIFVMSGVGFVGLIVRNSPIFYISFFIVGLAIVRNAFQGASLNRRLRNEQKMKGIKVHPWQEYRNKNMKFVWIGLVLILIFMLFMRWRMGL